MNINYKGSSIAFADIFYPYIEMREGKRNVVYRDDNGNPTVGIGHLVQPGDNLAVGDAISNERVQAFYMYDYNRLQIETYASEILNLGYHYNVALAVGSFIWCHGLGSNQKIGYKDSMLRRGLLNRSFDAASVQSYLKANWDIRDKESQERNRRDFEVGFSSKPWEPGFFLSRKKS